MSVSIQIANESAVIADRLHSAAIHLLRKLRREDASSGLNGPRLSALSVIAFGGPVTLGELAAAEQVRPPTMSRIVEALVHQGFAQKAKNDLDGRSALIQATAAGKSLLLKGRARRVGALAKRIEALQRKDREALERAAEILKQVIAEI